MNEIVKLILSLLCQAKKDEHIYTCQLKFRM